MYLIVVLLEPIIKADLSATRGERNIMRDRIRIYGNTIFRWWGYDEVKDEVYVTQREIGYFDYDNYTGDIVGAGTEDFSTTRYNNEIRKRQIYSWDGEKRNKGDKRWFDCRGWITYRKSEAKAVKEYLKQKYNAAEIQLR